MNLPDAMYRSDGHTLQHASCALSLRFVFPIWKWGAKIPKKRGIFVMGNLRKFRKFIISSISRFGNIKEM